MSPSRVSRITSRLTYLGRSEGTQNQTRVREREALAGRAGRRRGAQAPRPGSGGPPRPESQRSLSPAIGFDLTEVDIQRLPHARTHSAHSAGSSRSGGERVATVDHDHAFTVSGTDSSRIAVAGAAVPSS